MRIRGNASYLSAKGKKKFSGEFEIPDNITFQNIKIEGEAKFTNLYSTKKVNVFGTVDGNEIKTTKLVLDGRVNLKKITTEDLNVIFSDKSHCNTIIAQDVVMHPQKENKELKNKVISIFESLMNIKIPDVSNTEEIPEIQIDLLQGKNIEIESCKVNKVICKNAKIMGNCKINMLIYESDLTISPDSSIKQKSIRKYKK